MTAEDLDAQDNQPVTVMVSRSIRPGREREYEQWLGDICAAAQTFSGHLGFHIIRPRQPVDTEYTLVFRYATVRHLRAWQESALCQQWLAQVESLCSASSRVQELSGLETWFTQPERPLMRPPSRIKMAVVSWLGAFPLIQLLSWALLPPLGFLPPLLRGAILGAVMVGLMTYLVMPALSRWLAFWLYPLK